MTSCAHSLPAHRVALLFIRSKALSVSQPAAAIKMMIGFYVNGMQNNNVPSEAALDSENIHTSTYISSNKCEETY